ncbi:MAG: hypothetical protein F6K41_05510 [Symploca sp. SIO3E6]|nr:hypothetical protein [Caldora sp. SIO3E6]
MFDNTFSAPDTINPSVGDNLLNQVGAIANHLLTSDYNHFLVVGEVLGKFSGRYKAFELIDTISTALGETKMIETKVWHG